MRIDGYNQIVQIYGAQNTYNTQPLSDGDGTSMGSDQLSISQTGQSHQIAKNIVSEVSDVREDKVAKLKAQIRAGTYSVSPEAFAAKLLENHRAVV